MRRADEMPPEFMHPKLRIPHTASNKVDRKAPAEYYASMDISTWEEALAKDHGRLEDDSWSPLASTVRNAVADLTGTLAERMKKTTPLSALGVDSAGDIPSHRTIQCLTKASEGKIDKAPSASAWRDEFDKKWRPAVGLWPEQSMVNRWSASPPAHPVRTPLSATAPVINVVVVQEGMLGETIKDPATYWMHRLFHLENGCDIQTLISAWPYIAAAIGLRKDDYTPPSMGRHDTGGGHQETGNVAQHAPRSLQRHTYKLLLDDVLQVHDCQHVAPRLQLTSAVPRAFFLLENPKKPPPFGNRFRCRLRTITLDLFPISRMARATSRPGSRRASCIIGSVKRHQRVECSSSSTCLSDDSGRVCADREGCVWQNPVFAYEGSSLEGLVAPMIATLPVPVNVDSSTSARRSLVAIVERSSASRSSSFLNLQHFRRVLRHPLNQALFPAIFVMKSVDSADSGLQLAPRLWREAGELTNLTDERPLAVNVYVSSDRIFVHVSGSNATVPADNVELPAKQCEAVVQALLRDLAIDDEDVPSLKRLLLGLTSSSRLRTRREASDDSLSRKSFFVAQRAAIGAGAGLPALSNEDLPLARALLGLCRERLPSHLTPDVIIPLTFLPLNNTALGMFDRTRPRLFFYSYPLSAINSQQSKSSAMSLPLTDKAKRIRDMLSPAAGVPADAVQATRASSYRLTSFSPALLSKKLANASEVPVDSRDDNAQWEVAPDVQHEAIHHVAVVVEAVLPCLLLQEGFVALTPNSLEPVDVDHFVTILEEGTDITRLKAAIKNTVLANPILRMCCFTAHDGIVDLNRIAKKSQRRYRENIPFGESLPMITSEVRRRYAGTFDLQRPSIVKLLQYLARQSSDSARAFFTESLGDAPRNLASSDTTAESRYHRLRLDSPLSILEKSTRALHDGLHVLAVTAFETALADYRKRNDAVFGVVLSGRTVDVDGIADMLAPCITTALCSFTTQTYTEMASQGRAALSCPLQSRSTGSPKESSAEKPELWGSLYSKAAPDTGMLTETLSSGGTLYLVPRSLQLDGSVKGDVLRTAIEKVAASTDFLRCSFHATAEGDHPWIAAVHAVAPLSWTEHEFASSEELHRQALEIV
ncbi:uncharacterized protein SCHCODRAFT_02728937 [Schizophyllum commune H4-8]|nr:uncharacterized protein SCHCODRAFT_02728937 [Schizophyllum commune H4-8]KAI5895830.1 hypothetical protein SCHCODRAFT_02728937 [Schizophyllum commune H4-8]